MSPKSIKIHNASKAISKASEKERLQVLELYGRLKKAACLAEEEPSEEVDSAEKINIIAVIAELRSGSEVVVKEALKSLGRISEYNVPEGLKAIPEAIRVLDTHPNEDVRCEAAKALSKLNDIRVVISLMGAISRDSSEKVKEHALKSLGHLKVEDAFDIAEEVIADIWESSIRLRRAAAFTLGRLEPKLSAPILVDTIINDPDAPVRAEAAEAISFCLMRMEKGSASLLMKTLLGQLDPEVETESEVRLALLNAVTIAEDDECIDEMINVLKNDPTPRVRGQAAHTLSHFFAPRIEKALIERLEKEEEGIKKRIALALANYAMRNPLSLHDEMCDALIYIQKYFPKDSYIWKEAVKALPAC